MEANFLEKLIGNEDLSVGEARDLMSAIMAGGLKEAQTAAILTALRMKGETVDEIAAFAAVMREHAVRIFPKRRGLVDTCGTGGDARRTFNISTATALVAAAMGIPVAKHGNRAVSSRCGSADVLEALGVNIRLCPESVAELIDRVGIGFMFAPQHHPAMKHAAPVRKKMGVRTVFNVLGPLTNPAGVRLQLIGVFRKELTEVLCRVLGVMGSERAFVVHGLDGVDEVSISAETQISALQGGAIRTFRFAPEDVGIRRAAISEIEGGSPDENAAHIRRILGGAEGPRTDAVLLNAAFVGVLAGRASSVDEGVCIAREAIESGKAVDLLDRLRKTSHSLAKEAA
ncbi:MAG: anthranilate phosphoribosyltransferase [Candidatus Eisenbacteria sp.]|nr:anthranilate phosphoribosyltransferase [Candidatus Eisenbacteria bacterium]